METLANLPADPEPMAELAARLMKLARAGRVSTPEHDVALNEYAARRCSTRPEGMVPFDGAQFLVEMRFLAMAATEQEALGLIDRVRGKVSDGEALQLVEDMLNGVKMTPAERIALRFAVFDHLFPKAGHGLPVN